MERLGDPEHHLATSEAEATVAFLRLRAEMGPELRPRSPDVIILKEVFQVLVCPIADPGVRLGYQNFRSGCQLPKLGREDRVRVCTHAFAVRKLADIVCFSRHWCEEDSTFLLEFHERLLRVDVVLVGAAVHDLYPQLGEVRVCLQRNNRQCHNRPPLWDQNGELAAVVDVATPSPSSGILDALVSTGETSRLAPVGTT